MKKHRLALWIGVAAVCMLLETAVSCSHHVVSQKVSDVADQKASQNITLEQEEWLGPEWVFETDEMLAGSLNAGEIENHKVAIAKLATRIAQLNAADSAKPELMELMADKLLQKARFYEARAADSLKLSYETEAMGDKKTSKIHRANEAEERKTAREARQEMHVLYEQILVEYPSFSKSDKIHYHMGANLLAMGDAELAYTHYQMVDDVSSDSEYLAASYLGMAEIELKRDLASAMRLYEIVIDVDPQSFAALFATYKLGCCYFYLTGSSKALDQFEAVMLGIVRFPARLELRRETLKGMVQAYGFWQDMGSDDARQYFSDFAQNDVELKHLLVRLARHYHNQGRLDDSKQVEHQLDIASDDRLKLFEYQYEIMLNAKPQDDAVKRTQDIIHTVALFDNLRQAKPDALSSADLTRIHDDLEAYTLKVAMAYHRDYRKTGIYLYRALAAELYKAYIDNFPNAISNYDIMFYYGELMYEQENYAAAARAYDKVVELDKNGKFSKDAAHAAVLAYDKWIKAKKEIGQQDCPAIPQTPTAKEGEAQTYPEFPIPECRLNFINAARRYAEVHPTAEFVSAASFMAAKFLYDYNHYNEALPIFWELVRDSLEDELAVISADYLLEIYRRSGQYEDMLKAIAKIKANVAFMENKSDLMPTFLLMMKDKEEALDLKLSEEENKNKSDSKKTLRRDLVILEDEKLPNQELLERIFAAPIEGGAFMSTVTMGDDASLSSEPPKPILKDEAIKSDAALLPIDE